MKRSKTCFSLFLIAAVLAVGADKQQDTERLLKSAQNTELVDGNLKAAIEQYKRVSQSGIRPLAAQALVHMAECYQKLGDAQAGKIYEQIVRDYADQKDAVATARVRLGSEGGAGRPGNPAARLLCSDCGDYEANISTDGRWIAYTDYANGDINIRDLVSGQVRRLMAKSGSYKDSVAYAEGPSFSPDLRQVAYIWQTGSGGGNLPTQLRLTANEPGGKSRVLLDSNPENKYYEPLAWSTDGKSILVGVLKGDRTWQLAWISASNGAMTTIKSLQWRIFGSGGVDPKLSPDGRYIAYAARAVNPSQPTPAPTDPKDVHIYVLAADGSSETEVVKTAGVNNSPVWTPDGKHILFISDRSGTTGLWSVAVENGKAAGAPTLVSSNLSAGSTYGTGYPWPMGATRSGAYYYLLEYKSLEQITLANTQSGQPHASETFVGIWPTWSPDGRSIAFKRHHPGSDSYDLVVHSIETGDERTYPTNLSTIGPGQPLWFHDGRRILVELGSSRRFDGGYQVDLESGEYKQILDAAHPFALTAAALSADDNTLYTFRRGGLVGIDLGTRTEKKILATPEDGRAALALSPDGRTIALWFSDIQSKTTYVGAVGVDGGNFRRLCTLDFAGYEPAGIPAWTRDGRAILFEDKRRIMRILVEGGTPESAGIEAAGDIQSVDFNPDGSRIAYSAIPEIPSQLWSLDNVLSALK